MDKHDKMQLLPGLLTQSTWDTYRMSWLKRRDKLIWFFLAAFGSAYTLWWFASNWQSWAIWQKVCFAVYTPFMLWIILSIARRESRGWSQLRTGALALRQAVEEGDEQIAPLAAEQPASLTSADFPTGPERISLFGNWRNSAGGVATIGVLLLLFLSGYIILLVTLLENSIFDHLPTAPLIILIILLSVFGLAAFVSGAGGIFALFAVYSIRRHAYVVADESGVRWWRRAWGKRSSLFIPWDAARSFFMFTYPGQKAGSWHRFYVLDAHDALLFWHISYRTTPRILAAHERLNRLIVTRTRLPLRDLSAAAEALTSRIDNPSAPEQSPA